MPSKRAIAIYWATYAEEHGSTPFDPEGEIDWERPACMACGADDEHWPAASPKQLKNSPQAHWSNATLDRAHITLRMRETEDPDAVEKIVLLCTVCHRDQPDYRMAEETFQWMEGRHWSTIAQRRISDNGWIKEFRGKQLLTRLGIKRGHDLLLEQGKRCMCPECKEWTLEQTVLGIYPETAEEVANYEKHLGGS
jgi:hypothetical protein